MPQLRCVTFTDNFSEPLHCILDLIPCVPLIPGNVIGPSSSSFLEWSLFKRVLYSCFNDIRFPRYLSVQTAVNASCTCPVLLPNNILIQHKCDCVLHNFVLHFRQSLFQDRIGLTYWYSTLTLSVNLYNKRIVYRSVSPKDVELLLHIYSTQTELSFTDGQQYNITSGETIARIWNTAVDTRSVRHELHYTVWKTLWINQTWRPTVCVT